jgi:hypothetical protein
MFIKIITLAVFLWLVVSSDGQAHDAILTRDADIFVYHDEPLANWALLPLPRSQGEISQIVPGSAAIAEGDILVFCYDFTSSGSQAQLYRLYNRTMGPYTPGDPVQGQHHRMELVTVSGPGAAALNEVGTIVRRVSSGFVRANAGTVFPAFAFANSQGVFRCVNTDPTSMNCVLAAPASWSAKMKVNDLVLALDGTLYIATDGGLYSLPPAASQVTQIPEVTSPCQAVAYDDVTATLVAGKDKLWRRLGNNPSEYRWYFFLTPGIIDANITALEFDLNSTLWIANDICINKMTTDLALERVGGLDGLIVANLTSLALAPSGAMWLGSSSGVLRYLPQAARSPTDYQDREWQVCRRDGGGGGGGGG